MAGTIPCSSLRSRSWDTLSRHVLNAFDRLLAKDHDDLDATEYTRKKDTKCNSPPSFKPWYADFLPNVGRYSSFRFPLIVASSKSSRAATPSPTIAYATKYTSVCINPTIYMPWLLGHCAKRGVAFKRDTDGIRLERERIGGAEVLLCYGHGGSRYQTSHGCATAVVDLVDELARELRAGSGALKATL